LKDHQFNLLTLPPETQVSQAIEKTLGFLGLPFDAGPHTFKATPGDASKNIQFTVSGTVFQDANGRLILATKLEIPGEIGLFLAHEGYSILSLPQT
jgi:hypothetical protein